ncbi:MAG: methylisocitrate lyase [Phycisphaerales bacterium]|nr:MAG: methylisocitrate lyase [Phycisphaerales bacterium]
MPDALPHPGTQLRRLMDAACVPIPGAFNGLVARAVRDAGFQAAYLSGGATSAAAGVPDVGLLTLDRFAQAIREVVDGSRLPVLADADTGFGEAEMTRRTVITYHRAGAAGLHIEDQVFPKRCGHLDGKALVPTDHMTEKVAWARKASDDCSGGAFIICARTDAAGVESVEAAIERAAAYVQAGADMIFPEGLRTEQDFARVAEAVRTLRTHVGTRPYLLANMTEFGKTPMLPVARFAELGYDAVIFPVTTLRIAMHAVTEALKELHDTGTAEGLLDRMQTRQELYRLLEYTPSKPWEMPTTSY